MSDIGRSSGWWLLIAVLALANVLLLMVNAPAEADGRQLLHHPDSNKDGEDTGGSLDVQMMGQVQAAGMSGEHRAHQGQAVAAMMEEVPPGNVRPEQGPNLSPQQKNDDANVPHTDDKQVRFGDAKNKNVKIEHQLNHIQKTHRVLNRDHNVSFDENDVLQVLVVSYQRTGSTLLTDCLFNYNEDAYFISEPLDALNVAMYGVEPGWAVPQDITVYSNCTSRHPPQHETDGTVWLINRLLTCQMDEGSLPPEVFLHHFWLWSRPLAPYMTCLKQAKLSDANISACRSSEFTKLCGKRFGENHVETAMCLHNLWGYLMYNQREQVNLPEYSQGPDESVFKQYRQCLQQLMPLLKHCIPLFSKPCKTKDIRTIKLVRPAIDALPALLDRYPNMKVVHLFRDPRGVVRSRLSHWWAPSLCTKESSMSAAYTMAKVYCDGVVADYHKRQILEKRYPGRFTEVLYDEFVLDPLVGTIKVLQFLGLPLRPETETFIRTLTKQATSPREISLRWKNELEAHDVINIQNACKEFASTVGFNWVTWS